MLDYNTLNNLVEIFKKQGVRGVTLENGSTLEIKEGALLVNGKLLGGVKVIDTDNITALSTETIEKLSTGDIVVKHTGEQTHAYIVTYKEEHHGICISYFDAGYTETVSYDYVTDAWVYNSTDVVTPKEYTAGSGIKIENNTISLNNPLYLHSFELTITSGGGTAYSGSVVIKVINNDENDISNLNQLEANIDNITSVVGKINIADDSEPWLVLQILKLSSWVAEVTKIGDHSSTTSVKTINITGFKEKRTKRLL